MLRLQIVLAGLILSASDARAADWPQFRGPGGSGVARDSAVPHEWSSSKNLKWKADLEGGGSSSPIVVGDRVFLTWYTGDGDSKLVRTLGGFNRADGKQLWKSDVPSTAGEDRYSGYLTEHGYASNTPAADSEAVYAFLGKSGVLACDLDGKKLWLTNIGTESDSRRWGSGASPILYKNSVIVNASTESQSIRALDKKTGRELWKAPGSRLSLAFGTPALVKVSDDRIDLVVAAPGEVWGLNPDSGKLLWYATIPSGGNISPSVVPGDGVVYVTGGFTGTGTTALRAGGKGDVTKSHILWTAKAYSYVPTPVLFEGKLYWVSEAGIAVCLDAADGKVLYQERLPIQGGSRGGKPFYASPVVAGDSLFAVSRKAGTFVLKTGVPFAAPAINKPLDDSDFNATPAVAGKQVFLRSNRALYCLEAN